MMTSKGQLNAKTTFDSICKTESPVYFEQVGIWNQNQHEKIMQNDM